MILMIYNSTYRPSSLRECFSNWVPPGEFISPGDCDGRFNKLFDPFARENFTSWYGRLRPGVSALFSSDTRNIPALNSMRRITVFISIVLSRILYITSKYPMQRYIKK
jgi:hypothetical protein